MMQSLQNSKVDDANSYLFFKLAVKMHFTISDIFEAVRYYVGFRGLSR